MSCFHGCSPALAGRGRLQELARRAREGASLIRDLEAALIAFRNGWPFSADRFAEAVSA
jgi:hypothetical protein